MAHKIVKTLPDEFELSVAQEISNLENSAADLKADLHDLHINKIQPRLMRELEKKFIITIILRIYLTTYHFFQQWETRRNSCPENNFIQNS